jgi:predicted permease
MEKEISPGWNGLEDKMFQSLYLVARRRVGVSGDQASANSNLLFKQILQEYVGPQPSQKQLDDISHAQIALTPAATGLSQLRHEFSSPLKILMAVVGLVLLVACANVANLLLARATARQREIAVRMSMGAARWRLARQLLVESALLAAAGTALGAWAAWWAMHLLLRMVSVGQETIPLRVSLDGQVLAFTALVAGATVLLFGAAPAFFAIRVDLIPSLKEGRGTTSGRSTSLLARGLIVGQVALSLALLVGAGLFLRSLVNLSNIDTGFDKQNVLMNSVDAIAADYKEDTRLESMMQRMEERVNALPGVEGASFAFTVFNQGGWTGHVVFPGRPMDEHDPDVDHNVVGDRYFDAMGLRMLLGRGFGPQDSTGSKRVAVINETMARTYFPGESPLGRTFSVGDGRPQSPEWQNVEVVGVLRDAKYMDLDEKPMPAAFYPHSQHIGYRYYFVTRYSGNKDDLARAITQVAGDIDPNLPVGDFTTLEQVVDDSVLNHRLVAQLCAFFGGLALVLVCVGIYGLMSYAVGRRTNEFGVRLALGANRRNVVGLVLQETMWLVVTGLAIGVVLIPVVSGFVVSFLFGLKPYDAVSILSAILIMTTVAAVAGYLPARRAARVDPMIALRYE